MFGDKASDPKAQLRACAYLDTRIYSRTSMIKALNQWIGRIQEYGPSVAARLLSMVPDRGTETAVNRIAERLLERITKLDELIFPAVFQWFPMELETSAFTARRETVQFGSSVAA
jgi:hypothetical protein